MTFIRKPPKWMDELKNVLQLHFTLQFSNSMAVPLRKPHGKLMERKTHLTRSPTIRCENRASLPWSSGFTAMLPTKETARRSTKASSGLPSVTHTLSSLSWSSTASAPPGRQTHGSGLPCPAHRSIFGLLPQTRRPTPTEDTLPLSGVSPETLTRVAPTGQRPIKGAIESRSQLLSPR